VLVAPLVAAAIRTLGGTFVAASAGALAGVAVVLCAWRAILRGVSWPLATGAAVLCALCILGRAGVTFDPIAWFGAAVVALVADTNDRRAWYALVPFVFLWAMAENGATIALVIAVAATIGAFADRRIEPRDVRARTFTCIAIAVAALAQPHLSPLRGYGIHWLYLDAFLTGAQRDRFVLSPPNFTGAAVFALAVLAGWYGLRRRARSADVVTFVTLFILTLCDTRNAPFFAILCAPVVVDAIASFEKVSAQPSGLRAIARPAAALGVLSFAFVAAVAVAEPHIKTLQASPELPSALVQRAASAHARVLLCQQPRWCDDATSLRILPVLDDRAGVSAPANRNAQARIARSHGNWQTALAAAHVDAAIASRREPLATLLGSLGWTDAAHDGERVLLLRSAR